MNKTMSLKVLALLAVSAMPLTASADQPYTEKLDQIIQQCKSVSDSKREEFDAAQSAHGAGSEEWYSAHEAMKVAVGKCIDDGIKSASYIQRSEIDKFPKATAQLTRAYQAWRGYLESLALDSTGFYEKSYGIATDDIKAHPYSK
ncbi:hypothetical protein [Pseudomonas paracarnis]|uniref:Uncharacterized protein n=1 Tax=Pseudomonas paracarnis TaxID=2750625 RepID=A0ABU6BVA1_9PSED|nr:hypothetical protein [Pseudomonas paracarnis]MBW9244077.1 hypothetical protein [Pseudomonas paracarnis]MEB3783760.1 hypothetical protein [Pseudomonas paracarnis]